MLDRHNALTASRIAKGRNPKICTSCRTQADGIVDEVIRTTGCLNPKQQCIRGQCLKPEPWRQQRADGRRVCQTTIGGSSAVQAETDAMLTCEEMLRSQCERCLGLHPWLLRLGYT